MILICVGKINEIVARVEEINIDIAKVIFSCSFISILKYPKNIGIKIMVLKIKIKNLKKN